jgi:hypothetical protein
LYNLYRAPFLGQGANQAIQDAFCLTSLLYKHNHDKDHPLHVQLSAPRPRTIASLPLSWATRLFSIVCRLTMRYGEIRVPNPSKLQSMVYEYEDTRKFHTACLNVSARILGHMDTLQGKWGLWMKYTFFRFLYWTGLGQVFFAAPVLPVV